MADEKIYSSVGSGGVNSRPDVLTVQKLLNQKSSAGLAEDGSLGSKTVGAIIAFQRGFLSKPDGRIDPDGTTWRRLMGEVTTGPSFIQLPQKCEYGYYSYSGAARQYGTQRCVNAIIEIGKTFVSGTSTFEIGIGDISYEKGGTMDPHKSHQRGLDVDIRPIRKDGKSQPVTIHDPAYSLDLTVLLVEAIRRQSVVKSILFNDTKIEGVHAHAGHDNHLHVSMR